MQNFNLLQKISLFIASALCIIMPYVGYITIGLQPVIIIGGAALVAFLCWYFTYLKRPVDPQIILPLFVLTVAALQLHIIEEYETGFGPAMSRLFNISWSEKSFLIVFALVGPTIYTLTTLGLFYRIPIAGFIAWFIFIGPGVAEFTHFIFPIIKPAVDPTNLHAVKSIINGSEIVDMRNYYLGTTGKYYFPGMWTAVLPMIPGIYAIYRLIKEHKHPATTVA
jgi:hypothetical protein